MLKLKLETLRIKKELYFAELKTLNQKRTNFNLFFEQYLTLQVEEKSAFEVSIKLQKIFKNKRMVINRLKTSSRKYYEKHAECINAQKDYFNSLEMSNEVHKKLDAIELNVKSDLIVVQTLENACYRLQKEILKLIHELNWSIARNIEPKIKTVKPISSSPIEFDQDPTL